MLFTPDQWIALSIGLITILVINLIVWLVALSRQEKIGEHAAHAAAAKTPAQRTLSPEVRAEIEKAARERFERSLDQTASKLDKDLTKLQTKLSGDLTAASDKLAGDVTEASTTLRQTIDRASSALEKNIGDTTDQLMQDELEAYRSLLADARKLMEEKLTGVQGAMEEQRKKVEEEVRQEIREEKADLMAKFDTKLAEVLSAYLVESLGQQVDLGAQTKYIFASLNEHKKQLKEDILSEF